MCELATVIFCLVKMKRVCLKSNFSDKCDTEATLYPRRVWNDSSNKGEIPPGKIWPRFYRDSTCLNVSMRFGQRKMGT